MPEAIISVRRVSINEMADVLLRQYPSKGLGTAEIHLLCSLSGDM